MKIRKKTYRKPKLNKNVHKIISLYFATPAMGLFRANVSALKCGSGTS